MIGNFYRDGELYTQERVHVNDHDFRSQADGMAIPHALYDKRNYTGVKFGMRISSKNTDPRAAQTRRPCLRIVEI